MGSGLFMIKLSSTKTLHSQCSEFWVVEEWSHHVAQAGLLPELLLPQPPYAGVVHLRYYIQLRDSLMDLVNIFPSVHSKVEKKQIARPVSPGE